MGIEPDQWSNRSPGNLEVELGTVSRTEVGPALERARLASRDWARRPLSERIALLRGVRETLMREQDGLARGITLETGKPIREAKGELAAVIAKFDLSFADAELHLREQPVSDGPHPGLVRRRSRGPAAVIAPFNFPIHLGHGAALAHLLAGNPVLFKPSPLAAAVAGDYGRLLEAGLPPGVFQTIQGGASTSAELCRHPLVRSVCFTGSAEVGRQLAQDLAADLGKDLALELGGKNAVIVCPDANLRSAAQGVAEGLCLTAGQRCNATSRVLVARERLEAFLEELRAALASFVPGDPLAEITRLGPLISRMAAERFQRLSQDAQQEWVIRGKSVEQVDGHRGYYVTPAVLKLDSPALASELHPFLRQEAFCPILSLQEFTDPSQAVELNNQVPYGMTCSIYTNQASHFWELADQLHVANVYANLPTTFSPSTLPFGGLGDSGNRHPGGRGFIRFVTDEQAVQLATGSW